MKGPHSVKPFVVMRSHNDMPVVAETLAKLHEQDHPFELLCLDNESQDGTTEEIRRYTERLVNIPEGSYVPGRVINMGMELSDSECVVFLNSDCTPVDRCWLSNLLRNIEGNPGVAAVFGRQIPRADCMPLFAKDTEDTYGDGARQKFWRHCFSMASSAISRSVWKSLRFNEDLGYSEDMEWTWRARLEGFQIAYVQDAVVMHSHNYTLKQFYKRHYGEGRAEATIFPWAAWEKSLLRYSLMPYARQVLSDWKYCMSNHLWADAAYSPILRGAQMLGRRKGFQLGLKERCND